MLRRLLHLLGLPLNRSKMVNWAAKVDRIVSEPPGTDEGFTQDDMDRNRHATFENLTTWEIVCEEVLDTAHPRVYFDRARIELSRRGISDEEYQEMRRFAWLTAGWLNFEKMLWDWCSLDGRDIYRAIEWQFSDGWISMTERDRRRRFADRYASVAEQLHEIGRAHV